MPVYADEELLRLDMPVLLIGGKKDAIVDAQGSAQRLSRLVPSAEIRLLENCGHVVVDAIGYILPFLSGDPVPRV